MSSMLTSLSPLTSPDIRRYRDAVGVVVDDEAECDFTRVRLAIHVAVDLAFATCPQPSSWSWTVETLPGIHVAHAACASDRDIKATVETTYGLSEMNGVLASKDEGAPRGS